MPIKIRYIVHTLKYQLTLYIIILDLICFAFCILKSKPYCDFKWTLLALKSKWIRVTELFTKLKVKYILESVNYTHFCPNKLLNASRRWQLFSFRCQFASQKWNHADKLEENQHYLISNYFFKKTFNNGIDKQKKCSKIRW